MAARSMTVASAPASFEQVQTKLLYRTLWHRSPRALRCREPSTAWHRRRHVLLCSAASRICRFEIEHHAGLDLDRMSLPDVGLEFPLPDGFLDVSPLCRGSTYHVNVLHTAVRRHDHAHWNRYGLRTDTFGLPPAHNILGSIVLETFRNRIGHLFLPSRTETVQRPRQARQRFGIPAGQIECHDVAADLDRERRAKKADATEINAVAGIPSNAHRHGLT